MSKYRFKTRKEFIRDGLWDEKDNCPYYWDSDGEMNEYLGKDVPDKYVVNCDKDKSFIYDGWMFIMAMGCGLGYAWVGFIRFAI